MVRGEQRCPHQHLWPLLPRCPAARWAGDSVAAVHSGGGVQPRVERASVPRLRTGKHNARRVHSHFRPNHKHALGGGLARLAPALSHVLSLMGLWAQHPLHCIHGWAAPALPRWLHLQFGRVFCRDVLRSLRHCSGWLRPTQRGLWDSAAAEVERGVVHGLASPRRASQSQTFFSHSFLPQVLGMYLAKLESPHSHFSSAQHFFVLFCISDHELCQSAQRQF